MTFDKKARLRQIRQDIDGLQLQAKGKHQSSSHVPAGMTYAEVFSAAINATMRHKRAMVGNLSRKSDDDSPAEMTFEEIEAYPDEGVIDDCVRPSAISLTPQPGLARNTSSRNHAPPSRESGFGAGREGADGRNHMRGTLSASLGRLARQSSTNLSGKDSHRTDGIAGGFAKLTLPPAMVNSSNEAIEQQQQQQQQLLLQQGGLHKEGERNVGEGPHLSPISTTGGGPASPLHAQHNRLLLSQEGPGDSPGAGWGRQGGLGAMAWTGECMSPGSRRRADLALLELWSLDIADKEHGIFSRPYTAPSTLRGGKRHSSRSNSPLRGPDASSSPTLRTSPPRGSPGLRPTTSPVPATQSLPHGSQPQPPGSADTANPQGKSPLPHRASQQGPQIWADRGGGGCNSLPTDASRAPSAAEAAAAPGPRASRPPVFGAGSDAGDAAGTGASGLRAGSSTSADPRTWPFAPSHAAQGQGVGQGVDVILEEENEEEEEGGDLGEGPGHEYEDPAQERQKPGFYHIMRRAPHHITTATTPYLMGLPLEVLASMEEVPCLADVVARQIWHPPRQALNPAKHQQLREQVETAVAARKQRLSRVRPPHNAAAVAAADAHAGPSDAWHQQNIQQAGQEPMTTSSMLEDGDNAAGGQAHSGEPPSPGGHDKGTGSPGRPASPSSGNRKATDKLPKAQIPGEKGMGGWGKAKGLIIRKSNPGLESQLGWDTVIRGPQRASRTNAVDGGGDGLQEEDEEAKRREEEAIHKGGMKLLTPPPPAPKCAPVGSWVSQGSAPHQKKGPPAKASTWERAQFYAQQQQQQMQEREQAARIQEQQVVDKPIYTPGLLTQQQQAQRQRHMAQQHYTLRQQEQEREGMKMIQQEKQQQEQLKQAHTSQAGHEQQQQQQKQGVHAMKLQRVMSSRSHQDREERLQAARNRKQARDDKLRQAILLQNSKTPPNLPLLKNQLQTPPPSPPLSQIGFLDSLRPPRKAQLPPRNSKEPPSN